MEAIGLTASCLTIAGCAYTIIKDLRDLRAKYKQTDEVIDTLCVQVSTLRSAVYGLSSWMERRPLSAAKEKGLRLELRQSLDACGNLISALQRHLTGVKGQSENISARGKLRHILGEEELKEYNRMLSLQVQALSFLVQVIQLDSSKDRRWKFSKIEHQQLLARAKDDASTFNSRDSSCGSICQHSLHSNSGSTNFDFDEEVIRSKAYLRTFKDLMRKTIRQKSVHGKSSATKSLRRPEDRGIGHESSPRNVRGERKGSRRASKSGYGHALTSHKNSERNLAVAIQTGDEHSSTGSASTTTLSKISVFPSSVDLLSHHTPTNPSFDRIFVISDAFEEPEAQAPDDSNEHEDISDGVLSDCETEICGDDIQGEISPTTTEAISGIHPENEILELSESESESDHMAIARTSAMQNYGSHQAKWHVKPNRGSLPYAPSIERLKNIVSEGAMDTSSIQRRACSSSTNPGRNHETGLTSELQTAANNALLAIQTPLEKNCLHRAIQLGEVEQAKDFLALGLDVNSQDIYGRSPLHYACESIFVANVAGIELLLDAGAYINVMDGNGLTPLDEACRRAPPRTVIFLLKKGAIVRRLSYEMLKACQHRSEDQQRMIEMALNRYGNGAFTDSAIMTRA